MRTSIFQSSCITGSSRLTGRSQIAKLNRRIQTLEYALVRANVKIPGIDDDNGPKAAPGTAPDTVPNSVTDSEEAITETTQPTSDYGTKARDSPGSQPDDTTTKTAGSSTRVGTWNYAERMPTDSNHVSPRDDLYEQGVPINPSSALEMFEVSGDTRSTISSDDSGFYDAFPAASLLPEPIHPMAPNEIEALSFPGLGHSPDGIWQVPRDTAYARYDYHRNVLLGIERPSDTFVPEPFPTEYGLTMSPNR